MTEQSAEEVAQRSATHATILLQRARTQRPLSPTTPFQRLIWRASSSLRRPVGHGGSGGEGALKQAKVGGHQKEWV